ncbi:hypothetical protein F4806DRAFT_497826 [Annulohypoxylon nitens]|nr:hypothetical protein F4806DRAFT_497826 [Annulohypoxylon nitens]
MPRLNHLLLAAASLSAPALGRMLSRNNPEAMPCAPGTKMCHEDTVYRCSTLGTWSNNKQCNPPMHCVEDAHTQDAGCVDSRLELRREPPFPRPAPPPTRVSTHSPPKRARRGSTAATKTYATPEHAEHVTGDLRCNGSVEEMYDDSIDGWRTIARCAACITDDAGGVTCIPIETAIPSPSPCQKNTFRCNGEWEEFCADGFRWIKMEACMACNEVEDGQVECVPQDLPHPNPDPMCRTGEQRCEDRWMQMCTTERRWRNLEYCAQCFQNAHGDVTCSPRQEGLPHGDADTAPTAPVQIPEVSTGTVEHAAVQTPGPDVPDVLARALLRNETEIEEPPRVGVAKDESCFGGEVKCYDNGDRVEVCMQAHVWKDFGPCPNCTQLYNTRVNCTWDFQKDADDFNTRLAEFTAANSVHA